MATENAAGLMSIHRGRCLGRETRQKTRSIQSGRRRVNAAKPAQNCGCGFERPLWDVADHAVTERFAARSRLELIVSITCSGAIKATITGFAPGAAFRAACSDDGGAVPGMLAAERDQVVGARPSARSAARAGRVDIFRASSVPFTGRTWRSRAGHPTPSSRTIDFNLPASGS
jgi:hypothetical protein